MYLRFDRELVDFMRKQQGNMNATTYAKKLGLHRSTYYKTIALDQSVTLRALDRMGWNFDMIFKKK